MSSNELQHEMDQMLDAFGKQAQHSLDKIGRYFDTVGRTFDDDFRKHYLKMTKHKLKMSYNTAVFAHKTARRNGYENKANIITSTEVKASSEGNEDAIEFKAEMVNDGTLIEIDDSDDDEHSGMQAAINLTSNQFETMKSDESLEQTITNQNVDIADNDSENDDSLPKCEQKDGPITASEYETDNVSLVEFDPREESSKELVAQQMGEGSEAQQRTTSSKTNNIKLMKGIDGKRFQCKHCKSSFQMKSVFEKHQQKHAHEKLLGMKPDSNGEYHCTLCVRKYADIRHLSIHVEKSHKDNRYLYDCVHCWEQFARGAKRNRHEIKCKGHHFECYLCNVFGAKHEVHLKIHMRTHTGERPFPCNKCKNRFTTNGNLQYHLKSIHP